MVELVDTLVLEASAVRREGSSPFPGTILAAAFPLITLQISSSVGHGLNVHSLLAGKFVGRLTKNPLAKLFKKIFRPVCIFCV